MPRVKRGSKRRQKRKKILDRASGYFLTKSKLYRSAKESVERGLKFAYAGRKQRLTEGDDLASLPFAHWQKAQAILAEGAEVGANAVEISEVIFPHGQ